MAFMSWTHVGALSRIFAHVGALWRTLAHVGALWRSLAQFGALWRTLAHFGADRQADRQADTDRQTDRQTGRQTERQIDWCTLARFVTWLKSCAFRRGPAQGGLAGSRNAPSQGRVLLCLATEQNTRKVVFCYVLRQSKTRGSYTLAVWLTGSVFVPCFGRQVLRPENASAGKRLNRKTAISG